MQVTVNGDPMDVPPGATIATLVELLDLGKRLVVVEHNGDPVPPHARAGTALHEGDRIELVRAVAGG